MMWKLTRRVAVAMTGLGLAALLAGAVAGVDWAPSALAQTPAAAQAPEPAPPAGQTYVGSKRCASCHFDQYMTWKKTKHAKEAFESVPLAYRSDPKCMVCHATGVGQPTGYKTPADTGLAGTTCEACHGPGSQHEVVALQFKEKKKLTPEEEKLVRDSIYKILPGNVCITCHITPQGHKPHPKYVK